MSDYVFDPGWQRERDRLRGLESLYDDATTRYLERLGVTAGWRCLEVGCGAGAVASWMAERVGATGTVVATDLDTRFIEGHGQANMEVRHHDLMDGAPEQAAFDVVHARAVIEHVPDHEAALEHLFAAVRPGGWVLIEDVDFGGAMATALGRYTFPAEHGPVLERLYRAGEAVFASVGASASFGTQLVGALVGAGFEEVGGELHAAIVRGGTDPWTHGTLEQLGEHFVRTGRATADDVAAFLAIGAGSSVLYTPPAMASAWGRRPAT